MMKQDLLDLAYEGLSAFLQDSSLQQLDSVLQVKYRLDDLIRPRECRYGVRSELGSFDGDACSW